jgi:hypothetical protein|tara:strand:- start:540 stop:1868 length:1329 start_codon:yes stop_codon:yes gene_type:complete
MEKSTNPVNATDASHYDEVLIESNDRSRSLDLRMGIASIDYYEDIFSPTLTAKIVVTTTGNVIDGKGIYQGLPLRGGERVSLKIAGNVDSNPGLDFSKETNMFYVSGISNILSSTNTESFCLNLCSREAITNETARVVKRYPSSSPLSATAQDIINLLATPKSIKVDQTSNKYAFIGNMRKPFTVLTWLASKSVPETKGDATAGYLFYETQDGFNFRAIDKLITEKPVASYHYTEVSKPEEQRQDDQILSYATDKNENMLAKLRLGAYSSHRVYFDPYTFEITAPEKRKFKLEDYAGKTKNLGKRIGLPSIGEGENDNLGDIPTRIVSGILDRGTLEHGVSAEGNADPLKYQSQSLMRYNIMFTQSLTMTIPSNTNLKAGNIIECLFPKTTAEAEADEFDQDQSGLYMIKELCHHFDTTGSYTSMKLIRDTFGQYGTNTEDN